MIAWLLNTNLKKIKRQFWENKIKCFNRNIENGTFYIINQRLSFQLLYANNNFFSFAYNFLFENHHFEVYFLILIQNVFRIFCVVFCDTGCPKINVLCMDAVLNSTLLMLDKKTSTRKSSFFLKVIVILEHSVYIRDVDKATLESILNFNIKTKNTLKLKIMFLFFFIYFLFYAMPALFYFHFRYSIPIKYKSKQKRSKERKVHTLRDHI